MHNTSATSKAGQFKGWTTLGASTSISTDAPIFNVAQNITLAALVTGDTLAIGLVVPRAIKAPGTTTTAAPYSAEAAASREPVISHASAAISSPRPAWAAITRHGDSDGLRIRNASASSRDNLLNGSSSASSA